jgi:hypothetical protein
MRRRRRYEVVLEGLSGQATSHRSVISDHRSELDARESASLERARLEVIYGDGARAWRILVVRDDEILVEEAPHGAGDARRQAAEDASARRPVPTGPPPPDPPRGDEEAGPIPGWLIAQVEQSIARQRDRTYGPSAADADDPGLPPRR